MPQGTATSMFSCMQRSCSIIRYQSIRSDCSAVVTVMNKPPELATVADRPRVGLVRDIHETGWPAEGVVDKVAAHRSEDQAVSLEDLNLVCPVALL